MPALVIGTGFFALFDTLALSLMPLFAMSHGIDAKVGCCSPPRSCSATR